MRRRNILDVLGKRENSKRLFLNIILIFRDKSYKNMKKKKVDCLKVLYHFTSKFHPKAPALMHSNKGFPSLTKPKHPLKAFKHLKKKQ